MFEDCTRDVTKNAGVDRCSINIRLLARTPRLAWYFRQIFADFLGEHFAVEYRQTIALDQSPA